MRFSTPVTLLASPHLPRICLSLKTYSLLLFRRAVPPTNLRGYYNNLRKLVNVNQSYRCLASQDSPKRVTGNLFFFFLKVYMPLMERRRSGSWNVDRAYTCLPCTYSVDVVKKAILTVSLCVTRSLTELRSVTSLQRTWESKLKLFRVFRLQDEGLPAISSYRVLQLHADFIICL